MNKITFLSFIVFVFVFGTVQSQVTEIYTDYEGFWQSSSTSINPIKPENSHDLLAFRIGSTVYSTGVDDAKLTQEGVSFTPSNFRALPFNSLPTSGGGSYFVALGQLFDGIDNGVNNSSATEPFEANLNGQELTQFLTNGNRGLNLGSGFANIPSTNAFRFNLSANGITSSAIGGAPDVFVTQIAQPTNTVDRARFVDINGNIVGNEVNFNFGNIARLATWTPDFYNLNSTQNGNQDKFINSDRDLRFFAADVSAFGINETNRAQVVALLYTFSGDSDTAFIAYNAESLSVARQLAVTSQPTESNCDGTMNQDFVVQVQDFNGTNVKQAGFSVTASIETGPGELLGTVTRLTDATGKATFNDLVFEIGDFHTIRFENTSMEAGISDVVELVGTCVDSEWNGSVSTEWNNAANWTPNVIPNANFNVLIPSGLESTKYPILQANAGAKNLEMGNDTSIDMNGNIFAISGDITLGTNSTISGSTPGSNLYFSGANQQTIPDNFIDGDLDILTIENGAGVVSTTDIVLTSLLSVINGDFNTNNALTLACQFTPVRKTAQIGTVGGSITGNVTTEQCFPARRAFRLVTSSVNSIDNTRQNWQEGVNNTGLNFPTDNQNPNSGYGTHITGSTTGTSGFDATGSGNPSMFTFDNIGRTWDNVTSTLVNLNAGDPYRLLIRGDRSIDVTSNAAAPTDTKLSTYGGLRTGDIGNSDINSTAGFLSLVGNPYHAQVDMEAVLSGSVNLRENAVYVWDPTVNTRGAYVSVIRSGGNWSNNVTGSDANRFLQPMQAVFVETSSSIGAPQVNFKESYKAVSQVQTTVFSTRPENFIQLNLYSENSFADNSYTLDGLKLFFDNNFDEGSQDDFSKMQNDDENMARLNDGDFLSAEQRPYPSSEESLQLFFNNYRHSNYVLELDIADDIDFKIFIKDDYLGELTEITRNDNTYNFTADESIPESEASDRFSLVFEPVSLSTIEETLVNASLYPNPTKGSFSISGENLGEETEVEIYNMIGQQVYKTNLENKLKTEITDFNGSAGVYLVKLKTNQGERTFKLIKQ